MIFGVRNYIGNYICTKVGQDITGQSSDYREVSGYTHKGLGRCSKLNTNLSAAENHPSKKMPKGNKRAQEPGRKATKRHPK